MKATKAAKRLAKVEALLSNVIERYAVSEIGTKAVLQDARAAVIRAKDAVSLQASSQRSKKASVKAVPTKIVSRKAAKTASAPVAAKKAGTEHMSA